MPPRADNLSYVARSVELAPPLTTVGRQPARVRSGPCGAAFGPHPLVAGHRRQGVAYTESQGGAAAGRADFWRLQGGAPDP
jgi:hypothetical protein